MLVIRFSRVGRHNHAQYKIVVQEKTKAPIGKHIAIVGSYDPHSKQTVLKEDEIKKYLANGAQPSDSVYNLLVRNSVIKGAKRAVKLPSISTEAVEGEGKEIEEKEDKKVEKSDEPKEEKAKEPKDSVVEEKEEVIEDKEVVKEEKNAGKEKKEMKEEVKEEAKDDNK